MLPVVCAATHGVPVTPFDREMVTYARILVKPTIDQIRARELLVGSRCQFAGLTWNEAWRTTTGSDEPEARDRSGHRQTREHGRPWSHRALMGSADVRRCIACPQGSGIRPSRKPRRRGPLARHAPSPLEAVGFTYGGRLPIFPRIARDIFVRSETSPRRGECASPPSNAARRLDRASLR